MKSKAVKVGVFLVGGIALFGVGLFLIGTRAQLFATTLTDAEASRRWTEICDALSDKICQPTLHPLRSNVRPFLFYAYNPLWERPLDFSAKEFDMLYVGHSKFRWAPMERVLRAIEPIRDRVGRIGRHTVCPPLTALLDLARAAENYTSAKPRCVRQAA